MTTSPDETLPARLDDAPADAPPTDPTPSDGERSPERGPATGNGTPSVSGDEGDAAADAPRPREIGGQAGPEPTRYGDWEKKGRCTDF